jgi:hypothetical protein
MKINYIVTVPGDLSTMNQNTLASINANLKEDDKITELCYGTITEEEVLNNYIKTISPEFTHVVLISDGSFISEVAREIYETYAENNEEVYLPIVELHSIEEGNPFRGFLNASLWKPYFAEEVGELDLPLSLKGVDLILYGALIPTSVITKYAFKPEIKYYSFFEYFNRLLNKKVEVIGIPKIVLKCVKDYELKDLPKEEKLSAFKFAQVNYLND